MYIRICFITIVIVLTKATSDNGCRHEADLVFVVDSSGSVGSSNFRRILQFITTVVNGLEISPRKVQIGLVTFGTVANMEFSLRNNSDKSSVLRAISSVKYRSGITHTDLALKMLYTTAFNVKNGDRPWAPNFAVLITDGSSSRPNSTIAEAKNAHTHGIKIFVVGEGSYTSNDELKAIADNPDSLFMSSVSSFKNLISHQINIDRFICQVCRHEADLVFVVDSSGSVGSSNFRRILQFIKTVVSSLEISPGGVQTGLVTFGTVANMEFSLRNNSDKSSVLHAISIVKYRSGSTYTDLALKLLYTTAFNETNGDRPSAPNFAVVITDGSSTYPSRTVTEAKNAHTHGIKIFVVGVGSGTSNDELKAIADDPDSLFMSSVPSFEHLVSHQINIGKFICQVAATSSTAKRTGITRTATSTTTSRRGSTRTTTTTTKSRPESTRIATSTTTSRLQSTRTYSYRQSTMSKSVYTRSSRATLKPTSQVTTTPKVSSTLTYKQETSKRTTGHTRPTQYTGMTVTSCKGKCTYSVYTESRGKEFQTPLFYQYIEMGIIAIISVILVGGVGCCCRRFCCGGKRSADNDDDKAIGKYRRRSSLIPNREISFIDSKGGIFVY